MATNPMANIVKNIRGLTSLNSGKVKLFFSNPAKIISSNINLSGQGSNRRKPVSANSAKKETVNKPFW